MNIIKELTLEETSLKEEMKNNCLTKGKYIDDKAKDKFKMLCHLEDFEVQYHTLNKGIDELIKQCENEILEYEEFFKPNSKIHQLIFSEDEYYATINFRNKLKKLKGE